MKIPLNVIETSALVLIAISIGIYYLHFLPRSDQEKFSFQKMTWEQTQKEKDAKAQFTKEQQKRLDECIKNADADFKAKKEYACMHYFGGGQNCEPLGRGSLATALYDNWNKQRDNCAKSFGGTVN